MQKKTAKGRRTVALVVSPGVSPFEFAVACEVFGVDRGPDFGVTWYRFMVCGTQRGLMEVQTGFKIEAPYTLSALRHADTIVVPAGVGERSPELFDELRRAHRRGARIMSVCSGAFTLAAAGLLDGRPATTHWSLTDVLARRYPLVKVDPCVLYIDDGDVLTSAGTAAGIDLCLHVVRRDYGAEIANALARAMVAPPHRDGGQAQYIEQPMPPRPDPDPFASTLEWVQEHLEEPITVNELAACAAMSPRTFARRFRASTGDTPHQWLQRQRVMLAQRLLETTDLSVEVIAGRCGLGTAANLRQRFQRQVHTTPHAYRRVFRAEAV